jgi:hypothetical protein
MLVSVVAGWMRKHPAASKRCESDSEILKGSRFGRTLDELAEDRRRRPGMESTPPRPKGTYDEAKRHGQPFMAQPLAGSDPQLDWSLVACREVRVLVLARISGSPVVQPADRLQHHLGSVGLPIVFRIGRPTPQELLSTFRLNVHLEDFNSFPCIKG